MQPWNLTCPACRHSQRGTLDVLVRRLVGLGMFRRDNQADPDYIQALAEGSLHRLTCEQCGELGLVKTLPESEEDEFDWPEARLCSACKQPIPPERLELFPKSERCAGCQSATDRGESVGAEREFCERCGEVLRMRSVARGVTRYELVCPACGLR